VSTAHSYELATHGTLTQKAFENSNLNGADRYLIGDLGIDTYSNPDQPFGTDYYDVSGTTIKERHFNSFENDVIKKLGVAPLSFKGWLMRGAIREDDLGYWDPLGFIPAGDDPHDDPYGAIWRVFNHFYDPINNQPLTAAGVSTGLSAPNWAIGSKDVFANPVAPDANRRNHFTVFDARESMYRALTGKKQDGTNADPNISDNNPAGEKIRKTWWATTFRALGDVLHLNQDMAQPQHTRNEPHCGASYNVALPVCGHKSVYEQYVEVRARGTSFIVTNLAGEAVLSAPAAPLNYTGYSPPAFNDFTSYYTTRNSDNNVLARKGLADYSNRGFFTAGKNLGGEGYTLPGATEAYPGAAPYTTTFQTKDWQGNPLPGNASVTLINGPVLDALTSSSETVSLSTYGLWDQFLVAKGLSSGYTLTMKNYDDMADKLIPRAVAYSAGLINHFFRGRMKIELPDEGVYGLVDISTINVSDPLTNFAGFGKIKLKLSNTTPNNEAMSGGKLIAVLKFRRANLYTNNLSGYPPSVDPDSGRTEEEEIVVSDPANGGANVTLTDTAQEFEFNFQKALPINATDVRLQVVYRGTLGQETDAVVVATQDVSEPTFFSYMNALDYIAIGGTVYTRDQVNANPTLLAKVKPTSCVQSGLLSNDCFKQDNLTAGFNIGSGSHVVSLDMNLPAQRFTRLALLSNASAPAVMVQKSGNSCYPHDDFQIEPVEWQDNYDQTSNSPILNYTEFWKLRGVTGWEIASCVWNGDGSPPGSPDNRQADGAMSNLSNLTPWPIQINGGNGF
jgi:hypothetical protein